jgi:hypothetical protein
MRLPIWHGLARDPLLAKHPAQLIGEIGLNATCCVRLHGNLVWPSYNRVELTRFGGHPRLGREPRGGCSDGTAT